MMNFLRIFFKGPVERFAKSRPNLDQCLETLEKQSDLLIIGIEKKENFTSPLTNQNSHELWQHLHFGIGDRKISQGLHLGENTLLHGMDGKAVKTQITPTILEDINLEIRNFLNDIVGEWIKKAQEQVRPIPNDHNLAASLEAETKALEWLRVSFLVLKQALDTHFKNISSTALRMKQKDIPLINFKIFCIFNKKKDVLSLRLLVYNLDVKVDIAGNKISFLAFDHKNGEEKASAPALNATFVHSRREALDQVIILLGALSSLALFKK